VGKPVDVIRDMNNPLLYHYSFAIPFPENVICNLNIENLIDIEGNPLKYNNYEFVYYLPKSYDIVINEIMANPSTPVNLPEYEYIELYNRTQLPININNWKLTIGTSEKTFSNYVIESNEYVLVCASDAIDNFVSYGKILDVGTLAITNSGQVIILTDNYNHLIHTVNFSDSWYNDSYKEGGGWSLEMIDENNPCGKNENWKASVDISGGTPCRENSIKNDNRDRISPKLLRASIIDSTKIKLYFSEYMDSLNLLNSNAYSFSNGLTLKENPKPIYPEYNSVILTFNQIMQNRVIYKVNITDTLCDCVGNIVNSNLSTIFALSEDIEVGDIIINEVLHSPEYGVEKFVEIYNLSDKILDLNKLNLANINTNNSEISSVQLISNDNYLFFPKQHIVLSKDIQSIIDNYYCPYESNFIEMSSFPSYSNSQGNVVLFSTSALVIDRFDYDESMHFDLLNSYSGVSLERINYYRPTSDKNNWHSASETSGFATPGYINSQYSDNNKNGEISLYPEIFSPDNDGYNDLLNISYEFLESGNVGSIKIFDSSGRLVRNLVNNELLGNSGFYFWDGKDDNLKTVNIGIYIILFETYNKSGEINVFKKVVVLGKQL
jgi:hypothetical protein